MKKVLVYGLGYVGLPLSINLARAGFRVHGIDLDQDKLNLLRNLEDQLFGINPKIVTRLMKKNLLTLDRMAQDKNWDVAIICTPTPLNSNNRPDYSFVQSAISSSLKHLSAGSLLIVESTVSTGYIRYISKKIHGLDNNIEIAFSPERIDPLNKKWDAKNTPKLVAGLTDRARDRAVEFYSKFIDTVIPCSSLEVAETAKLLENSFRLINISFINELSIFCQKMGIDVNEVIQAASTKPYGFMPFYPSVGIGGHCIPVDPVYLSHKAKEIGAPTNFIDLAIQVNHEMPKYFVKRAGQILGKLNNKKILVLGVSYKPNISDVRETPVASLIDGLRKKGAKVKWHDDIVKKWRGEKSAEITDKYDLAIVATPHDYLDLKKLGKTKILNTRSSV